MSFRLEQAFIDRVHMPIDAEILDGIEDTRLNRRNQIFLAMQTQERGLAAELIREVNTRFVVVHPDPGSDEKLARNPWYYDGFSFSPGTLAKAYKELDEAAAGDAPWIMQWAQAADQIRAHDWEEAPARRPTEYRWDALQESDEVFQTAVLAVHPTLVRYDTEHGFAFGLSEGAHELRQRPGKRRPPDYSYRRETYAEHVAGLYRAYRRPLHDPEAQMSRLPLADEIAFAVRCLENDTRFGLSPGMLDKVLRIVFACHDLGKLSADWQAWAHKWQQRVGRFYGGADTSLPPDYMAAHTDFDPTREQKAAQRKLGRRPPHTGESAMAAAGLLEAECSENESLWRAAMTAIARHHSAGTDGYRAYASHKAARPAFVEALQKVDLPPGLADRVWWNPDGEQGLGRLLVRFDGQGLREVLLYLLLIRVLRLADQRSQMK